MIVCWLGGYIVVCCLFELGFCGLLVNSVGIYCSDFIHNCCYVCLFAYDGLIDCTSFG